MASSGTVTAIATAVVTGILGVGYMVYPNVYPENCPQSSVSRSVDSELMGNSAYAEEPWMSTQPEDFRPWTFIWSQKENPLDREADPLDF